MKKWVVSSVAAAISLCALSVSAQFSITPLSTFGINGWLAPNGYNGSTYSYLTDGLTERGLAYGNGHLYLVSRAGGNFIRILDPATGADLGQLDTTGVSGGFFDVNMAAVGEDGRPERRLDRSAPPLVACMRRRLRARRSNMV